MSRKQRFSILSSIVCILIAIQACNAPRGTPTPDLGAVVAQTQTALAVQQFLTATPQEQAITPTNTIFPAQPGVTPATPTTQPPSPTPTATFTPLPAACIDKASAVDKNYPDDTIVIPGELFLKTWTVKNTGTCTWGAGYNLVFTSGERMGGASPTPLGATVPPGGSVDVSVNLVAPQAQGEYQGFWKLSNPSGVQFGTLWVKIIVGAGGTSGGMDLGSPTYLDSFNSSSGGFYLGDDGDTDYDLNNGSLVLTAFSAKGDQWRISNSGYLDNFFLEARFTTGSQCSGKDSYGLIIRAPDQPDGIIDTGYVFNFSCDGKYRLYRMDSGNFENLINWAGSSAIKSGSKQANTMGVKAVGSKFQLYANNVLVAEFSDSAYSIGYFGLVIRSADTANFQVALSQIAYWVNP
ncbi:MAG: hypothetical protein JXB15_03950 [Anaerolineales bacterium]|nr:hypothetical protein [Anaerolineales bacterium]